MDRLGSIVGLAGAAINAALAFAHTGAGHAAVNGLYAAGLLAGSAYLMYRHRHARHVR